MSGWIKSHRKTMESVYGRNIEIIGFWHAILWMCNHKEGFTADGTKILPGQFMTSQVALAQKFKISRAKVQRLLKKLESEHQIEQRSNYQNTIITVLNWAKYQVDEHQTEQRPSSDQAATEQRPSTNKNANNKKKNKKTLAMVEDSTQEALVLNLLNEACSSFFRHTEKNHSFIRGRFKEGYTFEDFQKVIAFKAKSWGSNPKMKEYLRPSTLFGASHFDEYLSQALASETMSQAEEDALIREFFPGA